MNSKTAFLIFIFFRINEILFGQSPKFINYTVEDGIPSSEVYCIKQDSHGYVWIATDRGVSKFDGYIFKNYTTKDGLLDNTVFDIYEGEDRKIWFLSYNGKLCYYLDNRIVPYKWNNVLDSIVPGLKIARSFRANHSGEICISYLNRGMWSVDAEGKCRSVFIPLDTSKARTFFVQNQFGNYFSGSIFFEASKKSESILVFPDINCKIRLQDLNANIDIRALARKNGDVVVMLSKYLFLQSKGEIKDEFYSSTITIHNMYEDFDSCLWIGTRRQGVLKVASNEILGKDNFETFLDGKTITSICEDDEMGFWFATLGEGIYYCPSLSFRTFKNGELTVGASASVVVDGGSGVIYAGFKNGEVIKIKDFKKEKTFRVTNSEDASDYIQALYFDETTEILWVGTSKNLWKIDRSGRPEIVLKNSSRSFCKDESGKIWVAGQPSFFIQNNKLQFPLSGDLTKRTDVVFSDHFNKVWMGGVSGIYQCVKNKLIKDTNAFLQGRITGISEIFNHTLVIGTLGNGIVLKKGTNYSMISRKNGLSGNMVNAIFVDDNDIWVANEGGLDRISFKSHGNRIIENFNAFHGLPTNEIYSIYKKVDTIFLATSKGLVFFKYSDFTRNEKPPRVYLESVLMDNYILTNLINEFSYDENNFTFNYKGIAFRMKKNILYKYRLKGFSDEWIYTNNISVNFASLASGNYTFEVYAQNEDGIWSESPAVYSFVIYPPFWNQVWFYLLVLIVVIIIAVIVIKQIMYRIRIRNRLFEFQQQALAAQMNPHFIFNSLYSIQSFVLKEDRLSASKYLSKFSQLMRRSLEHSRKKMVSLKDEINLLTSYLDLEKMRYKEKFRYFIEIDDSIDELIVHIPSMLLQPFIENAIIHGVIHVSDREGEIRIRLYYIGNNLVCSITDNGIGREKSGLLKKEKFNEKSFGTSITEERLRIHCKEQKCEFYLKVEDNYSTDSQKCGTIVTFNLPFILKNAESDFD